MQYFLAAGFVIIVDKDAPCGPHRHSSVGTSTLKEIELNEFPHRNAAYGNRTRVQTFFLFLGRFYSTTELKPLQIF